MKEYDKCAYDVQSEADTIQEEKTRLLDKVNMMQKDNSDITDELSSMVTNHARVEEEILILSTMVLENIKYIEDMSKKNDKAMKENDDIENKLKRLHCINEKNLNKLKNILAQAAYFHIKLRSLNNANHKIQQGNAHLMEHLGKFDIL